MTVTTKASAGSTDGSGLKSSSAQADRKPKVETASPLTMNGSPRPAKTASRFAGVASSGESVPNCRSLAIPITIP